MSRPAPEGPLDDAALASLIRQVDAAEEFAVEDALGAEAMDAPEPAGDPCLHCGEPAQNVGECNVCSEVGCLPPDVWSPGMADPCLTLCSRCARELHLSCGAEDEAGNLRCPTCAF